MIGLAYVLREIQKKRGIDQAWPTLEAKGGTE